MKTIGALIALATALFVGSCSTPNPAFCSGDGDCAEGMTCNVTLNTCETPIPTGTCDSSSECTDDNAPVCVQEECVACNEDESGDTLCADKDESAPYCHLGACVECRGNDTCLGATAPICDADTCRGCQSHDECATGVCNDDGSCAAADTLIYLDPEHPNAKNTGAMGDVLCRADAPCTTFAAAVKQVAGTRDTILFRGVLEERLELGKLEKSSLPDFVRVLGKDTEGVRPGIVKASPAPLVAITNAAHVVLENIEVGSGLAAGVSCLKSGMEPPVVKVELRNVVVNDNSIGVATNCDLSITSSTVVASDTMGISVTGGTLSMETSTVTGSGTFGVNTVGGTLSVVDSEISKNGTAGIQTDVTDFEIRNSFLINNGKVAALSYGGARLRGGAGRFEFNTVAKNLKNGSGDDAAGINCTDNVVLTATSNIFWNNRRATGDAVANLGTDCEVTFSTVQTEDEMVGRDSTNQVVADPMFVDDNDEDGETDFHLQTASLCRDKADPASTVKTDIDGDLRDEMPDVGADEFRP